MKAMKLLRYAVMLVFVLASIRVITGASDLTSTGTASAALLLSGVQCSRRGILHWSPHFQAEQQAVQSYRGA